jgi:hypothetical protein
MTSHQINLYIMVRLNKDQTGEKLMIYEFIVRDRIEEVHREAEKIRLLEKAKASREDLTKRFLTIIMCRVGLISAC